MGFRRTKTGIIALLVGARLFGADSQPGLITRATDGKRTVFFVSRTVSFTLTPNQSIHPQLGAAFDAEWTGNIKILQRGQYTFKGDAAIWISGTEVQNRTATLEAGDLPIRVVYKRKPGTAARLQLQWESDFFQREPVPGGVLTHVETPPQIQASQQLEKGRRLVEDLNCIACHKSNHPFLRGRVAPDLSAVGTRCSTNWVYHWLESPQQFRPSALMPRLLKSQQDRADVTAYLSALNDERWDRPPPRSNQGETIFKTIGCVACHGTNGVSLDGLGSKYSLPALSRYLMNPLAVDPSGRMPDMLLNKAEADALAEYLARSKNAAFETPAPGGNPERGKQLVIETGCLNCHTLANSSKLQSQLTAPLLANLKSMSGCLAENPPPRSPIYDLSPEQRGSIAAWLQQQDISESPSHDVFRTVEEFNCRACHEYYQPAILTFDANQGPPPLSEAGYKLRRSWLDLVLNQHQKKRIRPWLGLRMPHFGPTNTLPLLDYLHAQAGSELGEGEKIADPTTAEVQAGVKMIGRGEGGLSCINCHDFRAEPSGGQMRGPDMTEMYSRIRTDWMRRWLRDPARIQPGTAMPAFFTAIPREQTEAQIAKIIQGLAAGKNMPMPEGLSESAQPYYLLVRDEPIVLRTFIQDSSPRSIAVGLPGLNSYVFDAQLCRLRYAWSGDFLDVKPVWADRGGAEARILGKKYFTAPEAFPIRIGDSDKIPDLKFRGYKLVNRIPEFMYEVDSVSISELITSAQNGLGLDIKFALDSPKETWFVFTAPKPVELNTSLGPLQNAKIRIPADTRVFEVTLRVPKP